MVRDIGTKLGVKDYTLGFLSGWFINVNRDL